MELHALFQMYDLAKIDQQLGNNFWSPVDVAHINDWVLRMAAIKGEYHWHAHQDDELFLVYKGKIVIETEKGPIFLTDGQGAVIPKGMQHKPKADERAVILMIEPARLSSAGE